MHNAHVCLRPQSPTKAACWGNFTSAQLILHELKYKRFPRRAESKTSVQAILSNLTSLKFPCPKPSLIIRRSLLFARFSNSFNTDCDLSIITSNPLTMGEVTQNALKLCKVKNTTAIVTQVAKGRSVEQSGVVCESSVNSKAKVIQFAKGGSVKQDGVVAFESSIDSKAKVIQFAQGEFVKQNGITKAKVK